jgi:hypothetical protein
MAIVILYKSACKVAAVAVKAQDTILLLYFLLFMVLEHLLKPGQPNVVIGTCCKENLVFLQVYVAQPSIAKGAFCLTDYSWIYPTPICTFACHNCYPVSVAILQGCCNLLLLPKLS